jgi:RecA-family ATPase
VVILSAEDDPEDTIKPRLELAGADMSKIHFVEEVINKKGDRLPIEIPRDLKLLEASIKKVGAKLLIIDPIMAFLTNTDANSDQSVRQALKQLSDVAKRTGCAIVCQRHLNKGSSPKAMYRGGGSIAFTAHARSALLVAEDPDDKHKRLLAVVKANRSKKAPTLRYVLDPQKVVLDGKEDTICRIGWMGESHYQADELVQPPRSETDAQEQQIKASKKQLAIDLLNELLKDGTKTTEGTKISCQEAREEAKAAGIPTHALEATVAELGFRVKWTKTKEGRVYHWIKPSP